MTVSQIKQRQSAFTIVELLIVILAIGILATITIVAYNGIQKRAQAAASQSAASQAAQKLATYQVTNGSYPAQLSDVDITDSSTAYQYTVDNSAAPPTYCITTTTGSTSYFINSTTSTTPTQGGCPGDGAGEVAAITNLATNPSLELNTAGWTLRWYGSGGAAGTAALNSNAAKCGSSGYRKTWTVGGGGQDIGFTYTTDGILPGTTYTFSVETRSSVTTSHRRWITWRDASGSSMGSNTGADIPIPANIWQQLIVTGAAPVGAVGAQFSFGPYPSSGQPNSIAGQTLDADCVMITTSLISYNYLDGNSPNWRWNGTQNASTSTGPAS